MKGVFSKRGWVILLALAALIGLILLASGMRELKFDPSQMNKLEKLGPGGSSNSERIPRASWVHYIFPALVITTILLLLGPVRPMLSKDLPMMILRFFVLSLVGMIILAYPLLRKGPQAIEGVSNPDAPSQFFSMTEANSVVELFILTLVVIAASSGSFFALNQLINRWIQPKREMEEIADIVQSTLENLAVDYDAKTVIIHCYERMNAVVNERHGITREAAMTPSEFAWSLEKAGLPRAGVQGLTHIFEKVRYGTQNISLDELTEAQQCLTSILKACKVQA
jgi:hypothetical protein